jgi:hypothetical protein
VKKNVKFAYVTVLGISCCSYLNSIGVAVSLVEVFRIVFSLAFPYLIQFYIPSSGEFNVEQRGA